MRPFQISYRSPWQNGVAERWVGTVRRELLDQVIVLSEAQLCRLMKAYVAYYNEDRTHLTLEKDTPAARPITPRPHHRAELTSLPRVGGLHHRYEWTKAAQRRTLDRAKVTTCVAAMICSDQEHGHRPAAERRQPDSPAQ